MKKIVLASGSPRRKELISTLGIPFDIKTGEDNEKTSYIKPHLKVMDIAAHKSDFYTPTSDEVVISADTIVYLNGKIYGKPKTVENAIKMIKELSGKTHTVYTGVVIKTLTKKIAFYDKSYVTFNKLSDSSITKYVEDFRPLDKAGAYGIQDGQIVKRYIGSYTNIVGLPMEKLKEKLKEIDVIC